MITAISNFNSNKVEFTASPIKGAKNIFKEGTKLGEQAADAFQKAKALDTPTGLTKSPVRFLDDEEKSVGGLFGSAGAEITTTLSSL